MALQDFYVNASTGADNADTGRGDSTGLPYATIQYALDNLTHSGDGARVNITGSHTLTAALSLTSYDTNNGTSSYNAKPLTFRGYTSAAKDGGNAPLSPDCVIDCGGFTVLTNTGSGISWYDLKLHNGPATGYILTESAYGQCGNLYVYDCPDGGIDGNSIIGCRVEDVGGEALHCIGFALYNFILQGATNGPMTTAINGGGTFVGNIIYIDSTSDGIITGSYPGGTLFNTVLSNGGSGTGITLSGFAAQIQNAVIGNYVEGFTSTNGIGIDYGSAKGGGYTVSNVAYNNLDDHDDVHAVDFWATYSDYDESLSTPGGLAKAGDPTYANRFQYFRPLDQGNMLNAWPESG